MDTPSTAVSHDARPAIHRLVGIAGTIALIIGITICLRIMSASAQSAESGTTSDFSAARVLTQLHQDMARRADWGKADVREDLLRRLRSPGYDPVLHAELGGSGASGIAGYAHYIS